MPNELDVTLALDRALERGDVAAAWTAAKQIRRGAPDLDRALALVVLLSPADPDRYEAAAARWLDRWVNETPRSSSVSARLRHALNELPSLEGVTALTPLAAAFGWWHAERALEYLYPTSDARPEWFQVPSLPLGAAA